MERSSLGDNTAGLAMSSPGGFWFRVGNGVHRAPEYPDSDYSYSFDSRPYGSRYNLARAHRISVIIAACLIIGISLSVCIIGG